LNWAYIANHADAFVTAGLLVIRIGLIGIVGSILIGQIIAIFRYFKIPVLTQISSIYIEISRNTPLLIQLFFLYFGLPKVGIKLESGTCAIVGLIFLGASYMAESFRSGYNQIEVSQIEAGRALGMSELSIFAKVTLPQSWQYSFASLGANMIFLIKETSVFSIIALADLTFVAKDLIGMHYNTNEALFMLVISYLIILIPLAVIITIVDSCLKKRAK
jgi:polar amino acid transport system permease protein